MEDSIKGLSRMQKFSFLFFLSFTFVFIIACSSDDNKTGGTTGTPYDPSKPIKIESFYPDSGGIATKVIIKGSNFGTDIANIKVYYNTRQAAIINSNGEYLYVITPRQPGDTCNISVVVGKDSLVFDKTFEYTTTTTVTTITGRPGTDKITDGTLAEAEFRRPRFICVDDELNIYISEFEDAAFRQINVLKNQVVTLVKDNGFTNPNAPSTDPYGKTIFVPLDGGSTFFEFDPEKQWTPKRINPSPAPDSKPWNINDNWKHAIAPNLVDNMMYTRAYNGLLLKFDGVTKMGWLVAEGLEPGTDSYGGFSPLNPNELYLTYPNYNCVGMINVVTGKHEIYAGYSTGTGGYADGERKDAEFKNPRQLCFDQDGNMYIADAGNHCIRKITPDGIVTTVIGLPGISGYVDGTPDAAQFNDPQGVAIDKEGTIYICDRGNRCIRKLAIE